jgi:phenylacetate-CoA ligase
MPPMPPTAGPSRRDQWLWDRDALRSFQLARLNALLAEIVPHNRFYAAKLAGHSLPLASLDELDKLPFTTKEELAAGAAARNRPAVSAERGAMTAAGGVVALEPVNLTYPLDRYVRFHQTSGTGGEPLSVLDTADDWRWWIECWQHVLDAVGVEAGDRVLLASSFGPFIAWWSAQDALAARGAMVIPTGGLSSLARIDLAERTAATALFCTPTYALRLAEVAAESGADLRRLSVRKIIVAGEPGGSLLAVRDRIESAFDATVYDHAGATEVGPWGFADAGRTGLHVTESEFIAEFLHTGSGQAAGEGELAELVLTTLGRRGAPVIRYKTGDLVRPDWTGAGPAAAGAPADSCRFVLLAGGVLGRADDMMIIRGVNVFPSSIEAILRSFPEVDEYRLTARRHGATDVLEIEVEDKSGEPARISHALQLRLGLKVVVRCVPHGALPRFEAKSRRFVDERSVVSGQ